jgi:tetratricopeptide (TPR) repeat protein
MIPLKNALVVFLVCTAIAGYGQFRLYEKGHDYYKSGKYPEAIASLTEYLTKSHRDKSIDIDVFYIRALSHYKQNHFQEAIPDFEESLLRGHQNKGNIHWFLAKCYESLNNHDEAASYYGNALRELKYKADSKAKLLYERSQIYRKQGKLDLAHQDIKEGLAAEPANSDLKQALATIEKELPIASRQADVNNKKNDEKKPVATSTKKESTNVPVTTAKKDAGNESIASTKKETPAEPANQPQGNDVKEQVAAIVNPLAELYKEEKRFALVIGNSAYPKQIGVLRNPVNDATDMAQELKNSKFDVMLLTDATYGQIRAALMKFKEKLDAGEPEKTVGLFYYAGHGLQFEDENYLVPVDASVEYEDDIPRYCFPINRMVLANMERSSTRMNIVILDACRNNPFPALNRSLNNSGLGEMKRARGSFIAYATAPGSVASDGNGRNGLYTQELLKALQKPGLTIEQVFKEVRANVLKLSSNKQNTWDSSNILGEFHFKW